MPSVQHVIPSPQHSVPPTRYATPPPRTMPSPQCAVPPPQQDRPSMDLTTDHEPHPDQSSWALTPKDLIELSSIPPEDKELFFEFPSYPRNHICHRCDREFNGDRPALGLRCEHATFCFECLVARILGAEFDSKPAYHIDSMSARPGELVVAVNTDFTPHIPKGILTSAPRDLTCFNGCQKRSLYMLQCRFPSGFHIRLPRPNFFVMPDLQKMKVLMRTRGEPPPPSPYQITRTRNIGVRS